MAIKKKAMCIDLDAEENIYHLKVKHGANEETFPTGPTSELGLDPLDYFSYPYTHADAKTTLNNVMNCKSRRSAAFTSP